VTEAGEGEDGRIRSSAGTGALLSEGIGDTIRVSLSEDPEQEITVAKKLAGYFQRGVSDKRPERPVSFISPVKPEMFKSINGPLVISNMTSYAEINSDCLKDAGYDVNPGRGEITKTDNSADLIMAKSSPENLPHDVSLIIPYRMWYEKRDNDKLFPLFSPETFHDSPLRSDKLNILLTGSHFDIKYLIKPDPATTLVIFTFDPEKERYASDLFLNSLEENNLTHNIIINPVYHESNIEALQIKASALLGRYVIDGRVSGISVTNMGEVSTREVTELVFSILQCTETRITRTIYLSCPTCGRTKFNLQESVKKVKESTGHLKGLKIAVMGCIVNGPGEMAGADYGYVGAANGKVHIYRGTVPVLKNIAEADAVEELLRLIEKDQTSR
jgi:(E)-4-hydroxy-3-methylbut-2-enyl-diphosphate synthase